MKKDSVEILGVRVDNISKDHFLQKISDAVNSKGSKYIVTPYSEFFNKAQNDEEFKNVLNNAYLSIADGIFVQWASKFNSIPATNNKLLRPIQVIWQYIYSGAAILLYPKFVKTEIQEKIPGSRIIYDICELSAKEGYKVAILGGFDFGEGNTGILAANKLKELYKGLEIVEIYPGDREKEEYGDIVIETLKESNADILFCCYGPVRQEKWLAENLEKTGIKVGLGLGGTLDYVSGTKKHSPDWASKLGLEWLIRPLYSEGFDLKRMFKRVKRAWWDGFFKSSMLVLRDKLRILTNRTYEKTNK